MPQNADDRQLIARIADRNQAALRLLVGRHHLRVHRFLLRIVRNEAVAEDNAVDLGPAGRDKDFGFGRAEAFAALRALAPSK